MTEARTEATQAADGSVQVLVAGVLGGLALPVLYLAWLNRGGPGEVCVVRPEASSCFDAWSPWPFAGAAVLVLLVAALILRSGIRARRVAGASGAWVRSPWLGAGWAVVGGLGCLGVLSLLTIGIVILPVAVLLAAVLVGLSHPRRHTVEPS